MYFQRDGDPARPEAQRDLSPYQHVGPSYFETLGIPIVSGRAFTSLDTERSQPVCIVDEAFVRRYLRDRTPVGARLIVRALATGGGPLPVRDIVGVVGQIKERPDEPEAQPHIYVPVRQDAPSMLSLVVQPSGGAASALAPAVRAVVAGIDKERPVEDVRTIATAIPAFRAASVDPMIALRQD